MNILVVNWQDVTNPLAGGAEVHFHEIFSRVVRRGHAVTLCCSSYRGAKPEEVIDGIEIIPLDLQFPVPFHLWCFAPPQAV
jgi:hypothetical protein